MHSIMQLCTLELNDQSLSLSPYEYIHALMNYSTDITDRDIWLSGDVHYPDNNITYAAIAGNIGTRSPYSTYYNSNPEVSRNIGIWMYINPNDPTQLIFESRCVLMMSPFVWSKSENSQCLFGIQNLKLNITLDKLLRLIGGITAANWVADANAVFGNASTLANLTVVPDPAVTNHILTINYLTPFSDMPVPKVLQYSYYKINQLTQNATGPNACRYINRRSSRYSTI